MQFSRNRCDMHTLRLAFGPSFIQTRAARALPKSASIDSSLAESMKAQVLTTSTSASSAREVISIRVANASKHDLRIDKIFAQPRLIIADLRFARKSVALVTSFPPE